jgi:hypothetical protein
MYYRKKSGIFAHFSCLIDHFTTLKNSMDYFKING